MSDTSRETTTDRNATDRTATDREHNTGRTTHGSNRGKWLSGITSLIGLWIAASPFLYEVTDAMMWNNVLTGAGIFLIAGYNYYRITKGHTSSTGAMSLVMLLGLWALLSPFIMEIGADAEALRMSNIVSGLLTAALAGYVAYAARRMRAGTAAGTR